MIPEIDWKHAQLVHLMWGALALVVLLAWLDFRGRDTLSRFVSAVMQHRLAERASRGRRAARLVFILLSLVAGILALMRPQTKGDARTVSASQISADIMVVLDVSKSMLAEDAAPTRLARAKAEVSEMLDELHGDRVGLVAFAGRASLLCPLTSDYSFFRMVLRNADPQSVTRGGTQIGNAIRAAVDSFPPEPGSKLMLLITDGEDHDSYPVDAAKEAAKEDIRIVTIGFGSEKGSPITLVDPDTGARKQLTDSSGKVVISRVDGDLLRKIALETDGAYVPAGTSALDLPSIVNEHIEPMVRMSAETRERIIPNEQYPWFVLAALVFMFGAVWLGSQPRRRKLA